MYSAYLYYQCWSLGGNKKKQVEKHAQESLNNIHLISYTYSYCIVYAATALIFPHLQLLNCDEWLRSWIFVGCVDVALKKILVGIFVSSIMFLFYWWDFPSVEDNINLHHQSPSFKLWMPKKLFRHQRRSKIHCIDQECISVAIVKKKSDLLYRELEFFRCHPPLPTGTGCHL